jgi:beta-D-xylosidase 4
MDRTSITWPGNQLTLIDQLAALGKKLVVVQFGGGQVDDSSLLNNTGVNALMWAGYPGYVAPRMLVSCSVRET